MLFSNHRNSRPTEPQEECRKKCSITMLPLDVHLLIRHQLMEHTDTTFNDFKAYRTVCKIFDDVWSPVVLSSVSLFPLVLRPTTDVNIYAHLRYLLSVPERFASTKTISIRNWQDLNTNFLLAGGIRKSWWTIQARRCANFLPQRLSLPNVRCARLFFRDSDTKWAISRATRALLAFPQLTELELWLSGDADIPCMAEGLTQITTLRKFTVRTYAVSAICFGCFSPHFEALQAVLARNPQLTHLSLLATYGNQCGLSKLLRDITPLKLEHLALSRNTSPCEALLPHIRSLKSFNFCTIRDVQSWCQFFLQAEVFPSTIKVNFITKGLFTYLSLHPGVVSLTVGDGKLGSLSLLSKVLAQHSGTLRSLLITSQSLAMMLVAKADRADFKKCTNLRDLVLYRHDAVSELTYEKRIIMDVCRLNDSLLLVLTHKWVYEGCVKYCRNSSSVDQYDFVRRIVYERRQDWE